MTNPNKRCTDYGGAPIYGMQGCGKSSDTLPRMGTFVATFHTIISCSSVPVSTVRVKEEFPPFVANPSNQPQVAPIQSLICH